MVYSAIPVRCCAAMTFRRSVRNDLRQYRTMIVVQLRRRIFRQTKQIEEARVTPLPTKFVKYDGKDASKCAIKALAVHPAVLP